MGFDIAGMADEMRHRRSAQGAHTTDGRRKGNGEKIGQCYGIATDEERGRHAVRSKAGNRNGKGYPIVLPLTSTESTTTPRST